MTIKLDEDNITVSPTQIDDTDSPYLTNGEQYIYVDTTNGPVTIQLASSDTVDGAEIRIIDTGESASTNTITIQTEGAENINPGSNSSINLTVDGTYVDLFSDGNNWFSDRAVEKTSGQISGLQSLSTGQINNEYYIRASDGESEARSVIENASYGDKVVISPGVNNIALTSTLTIPAGVWVSHAAKQQNGDYATFVKQFDGDAIAYNDWVTLTNVRLDGNRDNGYTGDGFVPVSNGNRELYWKEVTSRRNEGAGLVLNETFLSKFDQCDFSYNNDGTVDRGASHSPHNQWDHCRWSYNDRAAYRLESGRELDRAKFVGCLLDQNKYGIDTGGYTGSGLAISRRTSFGDGTLIQRNDGPGILLRGTDANEVSLSVENGCNIIDNNQNPDGSLTATSGQGDIHSENGGRISGVLAGNIGQVSRYNDDGVDCELTVLGSAGDLAPLGSTLIVVANDRQVGTVSTSKQGTAMSSTSDTLIRY